ncbi:hypothetical protein ACHHYP_09431 [Achlya hypogyna]|uniref:RING-type domain-containing protein n=1 Tax=Achlya hypogyna TaxID=1202772 RepID=A0A1V9ZIY4_ACHHY|nr:hypothetical protein ACHHYP_09431 [Achlya hypogyna]
MNPRFGVLTLAASVRGGSAREAWSLLAAPSYSATYPPPRDSSTLQVLGDTAIIYGGSNADTTFNDTWLFDLVAEQWTEVPSNRVNPGPRFDHVSVARPSTQELVVFGGTLYSPGSVDDYKQMNDVWIFSLPLLTWTPVPPRTIAPIVRSEAVAVITGDEAAMVVFGGVTLPTNGSFFTYPVDFNDLWALDLSALTWSQLTPRRHSELPQTRFSHAASTVTINGIEYLMVFSGRHVLFNGWTILNDAWMYPLNATQPAVWAQMTSVPAFERIFTAAVTVREQVWFFSGLDYTSDSALAVFADTIVGAVTPPASVQFYAESPKAASPRGRYGHRMAVWRDHVLVYGGQSKEYFGDLWLRNTSVVPTTPLNEASASDVSSEFTVSMLLLAAFACLVALVICLVLILYRKFSRQTAMAQASSAPVRPRGMSSEDIAHFELRPYDPGMNGDDMCPICLVDFNPGESLRHLTCGHPFHPQCIDEWLRKNFTCPMCKRDLAPTPTTEAPQAASTAPFASP